MSNSKWSEEDIQKWIDLYVNKRLSCQAISDFVKVPTVTG